VDRFIYLDNVDDLPNQGEDKQLLGIEGKLGGEVREEQGPNGIRILEPNGQKSEDSGATNGGEEATPVVAHRKVGGGDLYAEEHTFGIGAGQGSEVKIINKDDNRLLTPHGSGKTGAHTHGTGGRQHFRVSRLILIYALE